jgi:hypothetical protein
MAHDPVLDRIEQLRLNRELTMRDIEQQAGISSYRAILGRGGCTLHTLRQLCDALGVEITLTDKPGPYRTIPLRPCGTPSAARRHQERGEPVCEPCRRALNAWDAARKRLARRRSTGSGEQAA